MKKLIYVPLEKLDTRYTTHLDRDIMNYLDAFSIPHIRIGAPFNDEPPVGMFLHPTQTTKNKCFQLERIADMYENGTINDDTTFFFADAWFPGIENIAYLNLMFGVKPKVTGILHAGAFTDTDKLSEAGTWAQVFELMLLNVFDKLYCGSKFLASDFIKKRGFGISKLEVTGLPLDSGLYRYLSAEPKKDIIIFNGRNAKDKQPWLFEDLKLVFKDKYPKWQFINTLEHGLTKPQYYKLLAQAKVVVSFATQENFGFGIQEASVLGCLPVVPNRLCYVEQFPSYCRYETFEQACDMVEDFMNNHRQMDFVSPNYTPLKTWLTI